MFLAIFRYLMGNVRFQVSGNFPERFLNICAHRGLPIWGVSRKGGTFTACTRVSTYRHLRPAAKKAGVRLRILRKKGLPFLLYRYRWRWGLAVGAVCFVLILGVLGNFIWTIDVRGNETIDQQLILEQLAELGVRPGSYRPSLDARDIERQMMLRLDKIGWIAVNLRGSAAHVQIKERVLPPPIIDRSTPANVVAAADGQIVRMEVYAGQPLLKKGDTVLKGDVVVSGMVEEKDGDIQLVHARAKIMAEVVRELKVEVPYQQKSYNYRGLTRRYALDSFGFELPLWVGRPPQQPYKLEKAAIQPNILGFHLPIKLVTRQYFLLEEVGSTFTPAMAMVEAQRRLAALEKLHLEGLEVLGSTVTAHEGQDALVLTGSYRVLQDIAQTVEIFTK